MLDYQQIVDNLRSALYTADPDSVDLMRSAAADYAVACDEVNQRLRQCGELLRKGLRSEAIQLSEIEPDLLDVTGILDFPERLQWEQVVGRYGIMSPPPLMIEAATHLNEAYSVEQPLASVLRRHRLLAMGRAPLGLRLKTLRQLAELDPDNPVWREDLAMFEQERLKEIQQEAAEAAKKDDLQTLASLDEELGDTRWLETPSRALWELVRGARNQTTQRIAYRTLCEIEPQLNAAFSSFDVEAARRLRDRWQEMVQLSQLSPDDPLAQRAGPALEWLAEQDRQEAEQAEHQTAIRELERALDREKPLSTLEKLYHAVVRRGHALPQQLQVRYEKRVTAIQLAATRRTRLIVTAVVAACLLVAGLVGTVIYRQLQWTKLAGSVSTLRQLLVEEKLPEATQFLANLHRDDPQIAESPEIAGMESSLKAKIRHDEDRTDALREVFDDVRSLLKDDRTLDSLKRAENELPERTDKLLKSDAEKAERASLANQVRRRIETMEEALFKQFREKLAQHSDQVEQMGRAVDVQPVVHLKKIAQLRGELRAFEQQSQGLSSVVLAQFKPLFARLDVIEEQWRQREKEVGAELALTEVVGDWPAFKEKLSALAQQLPDSPRKRDFEQAGQEESLWAATVQWNDLVRASQRGPVWELGPPDAGALLQKIDAFTKANPGFPGGSRMEEWKKYLEPIHARKSPEGEPVFASFEKIANDPLVSKAGMIQTTSGKRYYLKAPPQIGAAPTFTFKYVVAFDGTEKSSQVKTDDVAYHGEAPQNAVGRKIASRLATLRDDRWEETFLGLLEDVVTNSGGGEPAIDPILKLRLLQEVVEVGCKGSYYLARGLAPLRLQLSQSKVNPFANWLDPKDADSGRERETAGTELAKVPPISSLRQAVETEKTSFSGPVGQEYRWIGWLCRVGGGEWRCAMKATESPARPGKLFTLRRASDQSKAVLERVGALAEGRATIESESNQALVEGRPVFFAPQ